MQNQKKSHMMGRDETKRDEMPWGRLVWMASAAQGNSESMTVGRCEILPGRVNYHHLHPNCDEILHLLEGEILHHVGGENPVAMKPGDTISIPAGLPHYAENTGPGMASMLVVFSSANRETQMLP